MTISLSETTTNLISDLIEIACEDSSCESAIKSFVGVVMQDCHSRDENHADWFALSLNARENVLNRLLPENLC